MSSKIQKEIKKNMKSLGQYNQYKKIFLVKQKMFVLSNVAQIFNPNIDFEILTKLEINIVNNIDSEDNWGKCFEISGKQFLKPFDKCDWNSFGKFMFYEWNKSKYFSKKSRQKSIYNDENFNEINNLKTHNYNNWMNSMLSTKDKNFNVYVRKVLKLL